ncbi:peptidase m28 [Zobellia amurskyensis]|uniref:Peptidase m28 n=1 Tax=Zobellia amurskyensis TaxID=248905 RepID=A0A7X3D3R4_9FLAO|nr:peptidase m28 [Zobellia amurskyensis]MUH37925.1 peptidase m28 [Zobellia amurskyensis]
MKKLVFGLLACASLLAVSCESSNTADDDSLYETHSVDKKEAARNVRA